jgi:hypothetical protein
MPLDTGVVDGVVNANFKSVAETTALVANRMNQDMAQNQAETTKIGIAAMAQTLNVMGTLDPTEASSIAAVNQSRLAESIAQLAAAIASNQQYTKQAQTTPPVTP